MMIRYHKISDPRSGALRSAGGRVGSSQKGLPAASIGSASAEVHSPFKATVSRKFSRFQKRCMSVSSRLLAAARSSLKSGDFTQTLFDIFALLIGAAFLVVTAGAVGFAFFILFFVKV